jgi:hypothetical protein
MNPPPKKHKVVVFDVDETLGNFAQFSIFGHVLEDYFNDETIMYRHFNDLVDLYPEIIRPSMVRILDYIRKKKTAGICSKVMIYTNNMAPDKWVSHIRHYFENKLRGVTMKRGTSPSAASSAAAMKDLAIIPPLFDHIIGGFKPNGAASSAAGWPQRTTREKTIDDFIHCSRLPSNIEVCFLDDLQHPKMTDERVYYIKLQPYYSYIPFETFVVRFLNSALFHTVFDKIEIPSISPSTPALVKKEILSIEIYNLFMKYVNMAKFDAKSYQKKLNPREIDEIISKYILFHLQQFFRDGPPSSASASVHPKSGASTGSARQQQGRRSASAAKTVKKRGSPQPQTSNVFYVNKTTAVKNMHNKTVHNR